MIKESELLAAAKARQMMANAPLIGALAHPHRADGYLADLTGD